MNETTTISEEKDVLSEHTIRNIVYHARGIATSSDALRKAASDLVDKFVPVIRQSGVEFVGEWYRVTGCLSQCLIIHKRPHVGWKLEIAKSTGDVGWAQEISDIGRDEVDDIIHRLPKFLDAYCDELERQNLRFADLREKAEAMLAIVEG